MDQSGLYREPDASGTGLAFVVGAALQFGIYGYYAVRHGVTPSFTLVTGSMFLAMAFPEFLPTERRRIVGTARIGAIAYGLIGLAYVLLWY